ncbi:MAG: hypothetical protein RBR81_10745 [Bacteroidales bacterium]|mgnify:CR=1 FL=1|jgi:hypothetical protein|nr:hypothetical protein [Bacteroidales bacterium]
MKKQTWFLSFPIVIYGSIKKIKVWKMLPALIFVMTFACLTGQKPEKMKDALVIVDAEDGPNLGSLAKNVHRAIYLNDGNQVIAGKDTPSEDVMVAFSDAGSVNNLYENNPAFRKVKLLRIEIASSAESNISIDLSRLRSFMNLKYVYILFTYNACGNGSDSCLESIVQGMVTGTSDRVRVIYELSIPQ